MALYVKECENRTCVMIAQRAGGKAETIPLKILTACEAVLERNYH